jgi:hypothetical protein
MPDHLKSSGKSPAGNTLPKIKRTAIGKTKSMAEVIKVPRITKSNIVL